MAQNYDVDQFEPKPNAEFICAICQNVLYKPQECPCRHVFCSFCIETWLKRRRSCPTCRKQIKMQDLVPVLPLVQNLLNALMLKCCNIHNGCTEPVRLEIYDNHIKTCPNEMLECPYKNCGLKMLRGDLSSHQQSCDFKVIKCQSWCGLDIVWKNRNSHDCKTTVLSMLQEERKQHEELKNMAAKLREEKEELELKLERIRLRLTDVANGRLSADILLDSSVEENTDTDHSELSRFSDDSESEFEDMDLQFGLGASNAGNVQEPDRPSGTPTDNDHSSSEESDNQPDQGNSQNFSSSDDVSDFSDDHINTEVEEVDVIGDHTLSLEETPGVAQPENQESLSRPVYSEEPKPECPSGTTSCVGQPYSNENSPSSPARKSDENDLSNSDTAESNTLYQLNQSASSSSSASSLESFGNDSDSVLNEPESLYVDTNHNDNSEAEDDDSDDQSAKMNSDDSEEDSDALDNDSNSDDLSDQDSSHQSDIHNETEEEDLAKCPSQYPIETSDSESDGESSCSTTSSFSQGSVQEDLHDFPPATLKRKNDDTLIEGCDAKKRRYVDYTNVE